MSRNLAPGDLHKAASTDHAIHFKLLQCKAAISVIDQMAHSEVAANRTPFETIKAQLRNFMQAQEVSALRHESSSQPNDLKKTIGGKYKTSTLKDWKGQFKAEQSSWVLLGRQNKAIPSGTKHMHIRTGLASYIRGQLLRAGYNALPIDVLDNMIFQEYVKNLNRQPWKPLSNSISLSARINGLSARWHSFYTRHTPAAMLDEALARSYQRDAVQGICSYSTAEGKHAVNLWKTEFGPERKHTQPEARHFHFSGLRHGVHDAYQIKPSQNQGTNRESANDNRVAEFVHAAFLAHLDKQGIKPAELEKQQEVEFNVVSVNLLTPLGRESKMIGHQTAAFRRAEQKGVELDLDGPHGNTMKVLVKPRFIAFNTPVNAVSLSHTGQLLGITRTSDRMNKAGLTALIGSTKTNATIGGLAGAQLKKLRAELRTTSSMEAWKQKSLEIKTLEQLVAQVRCIWQKRLHHSVGDEPYKLPVRLLAIANACNGVPAFNCKSGKDRTGQLNVEIRDFYAHLCMHEGKPREINQERIGLAKTNYQKLFEGCGDREIQTLNTGVSGSKAQLNFYNKLMDTPNATINRVKGLSRWVGT
ncbi:inositol phosphate phosphatase SopB [Limnobacter sp.]|uniref:inositol phosphate phosphatase SopB n=1 Tax=Limnobacter sp. TaxID=2003368 RepID=UPI002590910D|nr:inositol phosphate phosphatase SopB [Limnobacter sp.]